MIPPRGGRRRLPYGTSGASASNTGPRLRSGAFVLPGPPRSADRVAPTGTSGTPWLPGDGSGAALVMRPAPAPVGAGREPHPARPHKGTARANRSFHSELGPFLCPLPRRHNVNDGLVCGLRLSGASPRQFRPVSGYQTVPAGLLPFAAELGLTGLPALVVDAPPLSTGCDHRCDRLSNFTRHTGSVT